MARRNLSRWLGGCGAVVTALLAHPAAAEAQCIMCYLSASSSGEPGSRVLRWGILVLAIPTLLVFAGVFLLAWRRRHPAGWEPEEGSTEAGEPHSPFRSVS
jgi:hypothetical protein